MKLKIKRSISLPMILGMATACLSCASAAAQSPSPQWRVGLAKVKITPAKPIPLAGYASRKEPFTGVDIDLYAKALALVDQDGNRALLITADILGFPAGLSENVCRRLQQATGLERKSILLNGSHTHSGPVVALEMAWPPAGPSQEAISEYVAQLEEKIVRMARDALTNLKPARLSWGTGVAEFVMNRREATQRGVVLGVNPRGPADRSVPVLRVESGDGKLLAVVFGTAAHNVTLGGKYTRISGDYAGYAQLEIERLHPGVQAMFVQGCGGDANTYPKGTPELAVLHGKSLAAEVSRVLEGTLRPVRGPIRSEFRRVDLPLRQLTRAQIDQLGKASWQQFYVERARDMLSRGEVLPKTYSAPFALWQFGSDLTLVGFSGETVVDYAAETEKRLGPLNLWIAGYCNDLFGYLPSARVLDEGGYETRGLYMGVGFFSPAVEETVMSAVAAMARAAGRPAPSKK